MDLLVLVEDSRLNLWMITYTLSDQSCHLFVLSVKDHLRGIGVSQDNTILLLCNCPLRKIPVFSFFQIVLLMLDIVKSFAEGTKMTKAMSYSCEDLEWGRDRCINVISLVLTLGEGNHTLGTMLHTFINGVSFSSC